MLKVASLSELGHRLGAQKVRWLRPVRVPGSQSWHPGWPIAVLAISGLVVLPLLSIAVLALSPSENIWPHLLRTILPRVVRDTLIMSLGVCAIAIVVGVLSAWLITMYRFPGRVIIDRLLVMPLAIPTYIVAYCYVDMLDYSGPVQTAIRSIFGFSGPNDYWFPDVRSLGGAMVILASVLYPYVYLTSRASFVQQSVCALEVARTLGRTPFGVFRSVALPLARPAIAAGTVLVLMESLNDLGAVQHLGVQTFSASIYATWLQRSSLAGAAQLSCVLLGFIFLVLMLERIARRGRQSHHTTGRYRAIPFQELSGWRGWGALALAALPFVVGFVVPVAVLATHAVSHVDAGGLGDLFTAAADSLLLATASAALTIALALIVCYARRVSSSAIVIPAARLAGLGYAAPGTVLAIGLMYPLASMDGTLKDITVGLFGWSPGQVFSGTILAVTLAYTIRFLAVAMASIESGLEKISVNLDAAARTLGQTAWQNFRTIHVPLLLPSIGAAALLVFVDAMKELPATLLMRPFNFETLATHVYSLVALEQFERSAPAALLIVLVGTIPIFLLHIAIAGGRAGGSRA